MTASTAIVTDLTTAAALAPTAATIAKSLAAAGPIMDIKGMLQLARDQAASLKQTLLVMQSGMDSSDPDYTTVSNVILTLG